MSNFWKLTLFIKFNQVFACEVHQVTEKHFSLILIGSLSILETFTGHLVGGWQCANYWISCHKLVTATAIKERWSLQRVIHQATTHARRDIAALLYLHFECKIPRPHSPCCSICRMHASVYRRKELAKHEMDKHVADGRWCFELVDSYVGQVR